MENNTKDFYELCSTIKLYTHKSKEMDLHEHKKGVENLTNALLKENLDFLFKAGMTIFFHSEFHISVGIDISKIEYIQAFINVIEKLNHYMIFVEYIYIFENDILFHKGDLRTRNILRYDF